MIDVSWLLDDPSHVVICENSDELNELLDSFEATDSSVFIGSRNLYPDFHNGEYHRVTCNRDLVYGDICDIRFDWIAMRFVDLAGLPQDDFGKEDPPIEWLLGL